MARHCQFRETEREKKKKKLIEAKHWKSNKGDGWSDLDLAASQAINATTNQLSKLASHSFSSLFILHCPFPLASTPSQTKWPLSRDRPPIKNVRKCQASLILICHKREPTRHTEYTHRTPLRDARDSRKVLTHGACEALRTAPCHEMRLFAVDTYTATP